MALAVGYHTVSGGLSGFSFSAAGLALAIALFFVPYLLGGMGAGDVKLMGAAGAILGPKGICIVSILAVLSGGVYGTILFAMNPKYTASLLRRLWVAFRAFALTQQLILIPQGMNEEHPVLRYAVPIALGAFGYIFMKITGYDPLLEILERDARGRQRDLHRCGLLRRVMRGADARAQLQVLGAHVEQAGSLVAPDRLRFDFSHFKPLEPEEIRRIETAINDLVLRNIEVRTTVEDFDQAVGRGAVALFGEKYDARVRVVQVGDYSMELCGGTHVRRTGDIGLFIVTSEGSIASGVRRLEAITGRRAEQFVAGLRARQTELVRVLGLGPGQDAVRRAGELADENRRLKRELQSAQSQLAGGLSDDLLRQAVDVDGLRVIAARVDVAGAEALRELADALRRDLASGVAVLSTEVDDKILFLAMVTDDLVKRGVKAGEIVNRVARITGGGGGGKPNLAQAGGRDKARWQEALDAVVPAVRTLLG